MHMPPCAISTQKCQRGTVYTGWSKLITKPPLRKQWKIINTSLSVSLFVLLRTTQIKLDIELHLVKQFDYISYWNWVILFHGGSEMLNIWVSLPHYVRGGLEKPQTLNLLTPYNKIYFTDLTKLSIFVRHNMVKL